MRTLRAQKMSLSALLAFYESICLLAYFECCARKMARRATMAVNKMMMMAPHKYGAQHLFGARRCAPMATVCVVIDAEGGGGGGEH